MKLLELLNKSTKENTVRRKLKVKIRTAIMMSIKSESITNSFDLINYTL